MFTANRRPINGKENMNNGEGIRRAKAAPDFSKLHKQWDEKLQKGKAVKKKPLTSVQPFQLSQIPNRTVPSGDINFKCDPKAKESILNCKGITENTGRATFATARSSSVKSKIPSFSKTSRYTDISKCSNTDLINPEVSVDASKPAAIKRPLVAERSPHVKKTHPKQDFKVDFQCDKFALDSILNGEGISLLSTTPSRSSAKFGPTRRNHTKGRTAPFQKPATYRSIPGRDTARISEEDQEEANAAKKRWSIYNRESFSTKVDLMTWLKQLADDPNTKADTAQSTTTGLSVTTFAHTSTIVNATNSVNKEAPVVYSSYFPTPSSTLSSGTKDSTLKPGVNFNFNIKQNFSSNSQCGSSQTKQCDQSSNMGFIGKSNPFKFNKTVVGYQGFDDVHEEANISNEKMRNFSFITPENFANSKKVKSPVTVKSILKKGSLSSIREISPPRTKFHQDRVQSISKTNVKTPIRCITGTPARTPVMPTRNIPTPAKSTIIPSTYISTPARTPIMPIRCVSTPAKSTVMPVRSARKNTPSRSVKPTRAIKQTFTPTANSSCIQKQLFYELSLTEPKHQNTGEFMNTLAMEKEGEKNVCEERVTVESVPASHKTSVVKGLPEESNKKKVRWNRELTNLSPMDSVLEAQEESDFSTLRHQSCAVKLFTDEPPTNHASSSETVNTMANNCEVLQNLLTTTASSSLPSDDIEANKGSSFKSIGTRLANNITPAQSITGSKGITSVDVLSSKPAMSHQMKCVIPAEQTSEKSCVANGVMEGSLRSTTGIADICISSANSSTRNWADILRNRSHVNDANSTHSLTCVSCSGHSIIQPVTTANILYSTSRMNNLPIKKDKSKKKKRFSILERIYGDDMTYCDDSPEESCPGTKGDDNPENSSTRRDCGNNLSCGEVMYPYSSNKHSSVDISSCDDKQYSQRNKDISRTLQSTLQYTRLNSHINDGNQISLIGSTPILRKTVKKVSDNTLSSAKQLSSRFSWLKNIPSPSVGKFPQDSPSTFVTYSKNTSKILYGDLTESKSESMLASPIIPLQAFSNRMKNSNRNEVEASPIIDDYYAKNTEYLGGVSVFTPLGKKERTDYNAFIVSPRVASTQNSFQENVSPSITIDGKPPIYSTDVVAPSVQSEMTVASSNSTPQPCLRSDKLGKYVSSLLNIPASSLGSRDIPDSKKSRISEKSPDNENSATTSINASNTMLPPDNCLDNTNNSDDGCSLLDESEMCMVFSTPFKQGLRNHILHTNSFSNSYVRPDTPSETTNCLAVTPSKTLPLCNDETSAFRRVPATCNILPKFVTPIATTNKSDEMQALFGMASPTPYMRAEDAEIALYHQLGEISSRFHQEVNVLRGGVQNPLSIILTTGDEMHFVPIDMEPT